MRFGSQPPGDAAASDEDRIGRAECPRLGERIPGMLLACFCLACDVSPLNQYHKELYMTSTTTNRQVLAPNAARPFSGGH